MPASMISPDTGSRWKLSGSSTAMGAIGPMPGSTPISVPISAPASAKPRLAGVSATPKPVARWSKSSMGSKIRPDRDGQSEPLDEDRPGEEDQAERRGRRFPRLDAARGEAADPDQQKNCDHEAEPFERQAECDKARGDNENRPQPRQCAALGRSVAVGFAQSLHQNDGAEPHQNPAQQPRHVAGAHAQRRADGIIARKPQPERRDADEHEPGQHVLAREDAPRGMVKSGGGSHAALGLIALS